MKDMEDCKALLRLVNSGEPSSDGELPGMMLLRTPLNSSFVSPGFLTPYTVSQVFRRTLR